MLRALSLLVFLVVACSSTNHHPADPPPAHPADAGAAAPPPAPANEEACVDQWLEAHHLDKYGSPPGTMYAGGTPLFDLRTGQRMPRLEYVYDHHPDAKAACGSR